MISISDLDKIVWRAAAAASCLFALWIVSDTLHTVFSTLSPLPWFDSWLIFDEFSSWMRDNTDLLNVLFSQFNEHRLFFPTIIFFLDDLFFMGRDRLSILMTFLVQGAHAALFLAILYRSMPKHAGRWAIGGVIVALMFSLRQCENFSSGLQLSFVGVFAAASLAFVLFAALVRREAAAWSVPVRLMASLLAASVAAFTMANGLAVAFVLAILARVARLPIVIALCCIGWGLVLLAIYFTDYAAGQAHDWVATVSHPLLLAAYVATYLGNAGAMTVVPAVILGCLGIAATMAAAGRMRHGVTGPASLALFGIIVFCGTTALITASGRVQLGIGQALSSRYTTPSAVFWAAQLTYWWIDPPPWPRVSGLRRLAIAAVAASFVLAMNDAQRTLKPVLYTQAFRQNDATNLLALGLDDPKVLERVAWDTAGVQRLMPFMRQEHLSIFSLPDVQAIGRPITARGRLAAGGACSGQVDSMTAAPSLGQGAMRVAGQAAENRRRVRRVLIADRNAIVVGLASGLIPDGGPYDWRGYAVAPPDAGLAAYAVLSDDSLCRLAGSLVLPNPLGP